MKNWLVHPLAVFWSTSKEISTVEQRRYLYDQENKLDRLVQNQEWFNNSINNLLQSRENQVKDILAYQRDQDQNQMQQMSDIYWWINSWMNNISNQLQKLNQNQIDFFIANIQALSIIDQHAKTGFSNLLESSKQQTLLLSDISGKIGQIIDTLRNPRKIEWLEYKRDWITYLQKEWYTEALEYFYLSSEKLTTDQEVYFFLWLIEFEHSNNYNKAAEHFDKAIKYSEWYGDTKVNIQASDKLASVLFISLWDKEDNELTHKIFDLQLHAVKSNNWINQRHVYDLLKYSVYVENYDIFEEHLYILLRENSSLILEIYSDQVFVTNLDSLLIIDNVIEKIRKEDLESTKGHINHLQWEIQRLESCNYLAWQVLYIDSKVIIIWNNNWEITQILRVSKNYEEVRSISKWDMMNQWLKYVKIYSNDKNTIYGLSDTSEELKWEKNAKCFFMDSNLWFYGSLHKGKLSVTQLKDWDRCIYIWWDGKNMLEQVSKYTLSNDTKVSSRTALKEISWGNWKINFIKPNWKPLLYLSKYQELVGKYKEIDNFIEEHISLSFDKKWYWELKIFNEIFPVMRAKNMYGFYDYSINFK